MMRLYRDRSLLVVILVLAQWSNQPSLERTNCTRTRGYMEGNGASRSYGGEPLPVPFFFRTRLLGEHNGIHVSLIVEQKDNRFTGKKSGGERT